MAITADDNKAIRSYVGTNATDPTDVDISSRWDRLGSVQLVAQEILRERRANLVLADALKVDVANDYSEDATANLKALDETLATLAGQTGTDDRVLPLLTLGELVRPDWNR